MKELDSHSEPSTLLPPYQGAYAGLPVPIVRAPSVVSGMSAPCTHSSAVAGASPVVSDAAGVSSSGAHAAAMIAKAARPIMSFRIVHTPCCCVDGIGWERSGERPLATGA